MNFFLLSGNAKKKRFEEFLAIEQKRVYNYLLKLVDRPEDAEDALQTVFVNFWQKMDAIAEPAWGSYLYRAAYNTAINLRKHRRRQEERYLLTDDITLIADLQPPLPEESESVDSGMVLEALRQLPPEYTELIELQFYQNKSYKEIAELTGTTVKSVESRLVRAKRILRKIFVRDNEGKIVLKDEPRGKK